MVRAGPRRWVVLDLEKVRKPLAVDTVRFKGRLEGLAPGAYVEADTREESNIYRESHKEN